MVKQLNTRKHRDENKPYEADQGLSQKARRQVRAFERGPTRTVARPVYRVDLPHPVIHAEHGNPARSPRLTSGQAEPQGLLLGTRVGDDRRSQCPRVMRGICPRRSGVSLQERWQNYRTGKGK